MTNYLKFYNPVWFNVHTFEEIQPLNSVGKVITKVTLYCDKDNDFNIKENEHFTDTKPKNGTYLLRGDVEIK